MARRFFGRNTSTPSEDGVLVRELANRHLLLVPTTVGVDDVAYLLRSRIPDSDLVTDGEVALGRHSRLTGPYDLSLEDAVDAHVPLPWTVCYALEAPIEREAPPLPGLDDRDGFAWAFPEGLPWRDEGRSLQLMVSMARRLHGAVRTGMTFQLIEPDPARAVDYVIHTPHFLDAEMLLPIVGRVLPGIQLAAEGAEYFGPPAEVYSGEAVQQETRHDPLTARDFEDLHASADSVDIQTLAQDTVLDAYAMVGEIGPGGVDGLLDVLVHLSEPNEPSVVGQPWASEPFVTYEVRWNYQDAEQRERRYPDRAYLDARDRARPVVEAVARAVVETTSGVVIDEDGFWLDRYQLR